jgi:hypothetical protein
MKRYHLDVRYYFTTTRMVTITLFYKGLKVISRHYYCESDIKESNLPIPSDDLQAETRLRELAIIRQWARLVKYVF